MSELWNRQLILNVQVMIVICFKRRSTLIFNVGLAKVFREKSGTISETHPARNQLL